MVSEGNIPPMDTAGSPRMAPDDATDGSLSDAGRHVAEAIAYARQYLLTQADRAKAAVRHVVILATVGIVAATIAATILITSSVLLCLGIADGIASLLGGRQWAGDLITAGIVLGTILISARLAYGGMIRAARERTRIEYESRSRN
jgi:hypothetical protein